MSLYDAITHDIRPGDWLTLALGILAVGLLVGRLWGGGEADRVIIRSGGKVLLEAPLSRDRRIEVLGPLGTSVVEIVNGRARIAADPSPRQYCVRQGWLAQAGEVAVCLPNQVSVELVGARKPYDSLNY